MTPTTPFKRRGYAPRNAESLVNEAGKMETIDQINVQYGLCLNHIVQVSDSELVLFISEARVDEEQIKEMTFNEGTEHFVSLKGNPIVADASCSKYKVTFRRFFVYQVVEDSAIEWSDSEEFTGDLPRTFTKSRFLNHIKGHLNVAWFNEVPEMEYKHYQFACLDFVVDVAGQQSPIIEEVKSFNV